MPQRKQNTPTTEEYKIETLVQNNAKVLLYFILYLNKQDIFLFFSFLYFHFRTFIIICNTQSITKCKTGLSTLTVQPVELGKIETRKNILDLLESKRKLKIKIINL